MNIELKIQLSRSSEGRSEIKTEVKNEPPHVTIADESVSDFQNTWLPDIKQPKQESSKQVTKIDIKLHDKY